MATLVCFHAHPDDEAIITAGVMALSADAGHRVVLVVATRGELGEPTPGVLQPGEALGERREVETRHSARIVGAQRVEFLGYTDSGMMGEATNDDPACFWRADVEEAAGRVARLLREEGADALTIDDDHGLYGHPDHIQVHRVGRRAAELAGLSERQVFCSTMNRDRILAMRGAFAEATPPDEEPDELDDDFGVPEAALTHGVDVGPVLERKRAAMRAHASQISADDLLLRMSSETFRRAFGTEWFVCLGRGRAAGEPLRSQLIEAAG